MTKVVGILRGGQGKEYEKSLREGGEILTLIHENLAPEWRPVDILIDRDGVWHFRGVPVKPFDLVNKVDIVWNTAHPSEAAIFERMTIPSVNPSAFSKTLSESGEMLREHMEKIGVKMPRHLVIPTYQADFDGDKNKYIIKKAQEVLHKFPAPWIVKTFTPDQNTAIHLVKTYPELVDAIADVVAHGQSILVEEFISGKIASVHSVAGFRNEKIYVFPVENLRTEEKNQLMRSAKDIHEHLGVRHYLRSDFILTSKGNVFLFNVEALPDFRKDSHFAETCEKVGARVHHVIEHILRKAL